MKLIQKTTHQAVARTTLTEAEILRILTEAVAAKAGMSLDDANVAVGSQYLSRSTGSLTSEFNATIEIVRDLSAPTPESEGSYKFAHNYIDGITLGVNNSALLNVATYVDHKTMPHTMRSVATLEDGRPQWQISKDGTIRVGNTTHRPDGTTHYDGGTLQATFGPKC